MKRWLNTLLVCAIAVVWSTGAYAQDDGKNKGKEKKMDPEVIFKKIDENKDGKITKEEYKKWAEGQTKFKDKADGADKLWSRLDENQDGVVTLEEYKKAMENMKKKKKDK